jgi:hypothetical protein
MRPFCFVLLVLSLAPASDPQSVLHISDSGTGFLEACKNVELDYAPSYAINNALCMGWMLGFTQGATTSEEFGGIPLEKRMSCPSEKVTAIQFYRVIKKYLDEHPERAHMVTRYLASEALIQAFPCKSDGR